MPLVTGTKWKHESLDIGWLEGGSHNAWADAYALVWSGEPIYCAGAVHVIDKEYLISTSGWHGMTDGDKESLSVHLQSLNLTPMEKVQFCDGI